MATFIKYNGVSFNKEWAASKTLKEFSEHEKHHGFTPDQYKEVHELCKKKTEEKKSEEKQQAETPPAA